MRKQKIAYYAINGTGLGHLTRLMSIAFSLRELEPEVHQLFLTNAKFLNPLQELNFPYIALPASDIDPVVTPNRQQVTLDKRTNLTILYDAVKNYSPDLLILDTHFNQKWLRYIHQSLDVKLGMILRITSSDYLQNLLDQNILSCFGFIIIPHSEDFFNQFILPSHRQQLKEKHQLVFTGDITRVHLPINLKSRLPNRPYILITAGAGGYIKVTKHLIEVCLEAAQKIIEQNPDWVIVIIGGPYFDLPEELDKEILFLPQVNNLIPWLSNAKLVFTHSGYNTVNEILAVGVAAVCIPTWRKNENQEERILYWKKKRSLGLFYLGENVEKLVEIAYSQLAAHSPKPIQLKGARLAGAYLQKELKNLEQGSRKKWSIRLPIDTLDEQVVMLTIKELNQALEQLNLQQFQKLYWDIKLQKDTTIILANQIEEISKKLLSVMLPSHRWQVRFNGIANNRQLFDLAKLMQERNIICFNLIMEIELENIVDKEWIFSIFEECRHLSLPFKVDIVQVKSLN